MAANVPKADHIVVTHLDEIACEYQQMFQELWGYVEATVHYMVMMGKNGAVTEWINAVACETMMLSNREVRGFEPPAWS